MQLLRAIVEESHQARLAFFVIGGIAMNVSGHARLTFDLDLLIPRRDVEEWTALAEKLGHARIPEQTAFAQFAPPLKNMWPVDLMLVSAETFGKMDGQKLAHSAGAAGFAKDYRSRKNLRLASGVNRYGLAG